MDKKPSGKWLIGSHLKQDTDAEIHEWLREINDTFPGVIYGHRANGQVGFLHTSGQEEGEVN